MGRVSGPQQFGPPQPQKIKIEIELGEKLAALVEALLGGDPAVQKRLDAARRGLARDEKELEQAVKAAVPK